MAVVGHRGFPAHAADETNHFQGISFSRRLYNKCAANAAPGVVMVIIDGPVDLPALRPHTSCTDDLAEQALTLPSSIDRSVEPARPPAVVFRGSKSLCHEFSLVLEAKAIEHNVQESQGSWELTVTPALVHAAYEEISRYSAERSIPRTTPNPIKPFAGAVTGAMGYVLILLLTAYCA